MPITLPPISRRRFLAGSLAAGLGLLARQGGLLANEAKRDPNRFALLSDIHINGDKTLLHKTGTNPWTNLQQATGEILKLDPAPSAGFVCGDCTWLEGQLEDYVTLLEGLAPLRQSGLPLHLALGNHDTREHFRAVFPLNDKWQSSFPERNILIVPTPYANWFILDTLKVTNKTPGLLGEEQLKWLAKALDARADKPALIMAHHDLADGAKGTFLEDADAFLEVVMPRKQVKAYIYGHTHVWKHRTQDGLHLINLPTNAWLFNQKLANGWVDATLRPDGAVFQLHALKSEHASNGEKLDLKWR